MTLHRYILRTLAIAAARGLVFGVVVILLAVAMVWGGLWGGR